MKAFGTYRILSGEVQRRPYGGETQSTQICIVPAASPESDKCGHSIQ